VSAVFARVAGLPICAAVFGSFQGMMLCAGLEAGCPHAGGHHSLLRRIRGQPGGLVIVYYADQLLLLISNVYSVVDLLLRALPIDYCHFYSPTVCTHCSRKIRTVSAARHPSLRVR
jgi:hypothetical protein